MTEFFDDMDPEELEGILLPDDVDLSDLPDDLGTDQLN